MGKEIYPYILQEIQPTLTELGISTPEEMGYANQNCGLGTSLKNKQSTVIDGCSVQADETFFIIILRSSHLLIRNGIHFYGHAVSISILFKAGDYLYTPYTISETNFLKDSREYLLNWRSYSYEFNSRPKLRDR